MPLESGTSTVCEDGPGMISDFICLFPITVRREWLPHDPLANVIFSSLFERTLGANMLK